MLLINDKTYFCKLLTKSTDYIRCKEKSFFNYFFLYWAKVRIAKFLIKLSLLHNWVFYQLYQNVYHLFWSLKKTCELIEFQVFNTIWAYFHYSKKVLELYSYSCFCYFIKEISYVPFLRDYAWKEDGRSNRIIQYSTTHNKKCLCNIFF